MAGLDKKQTDIVLAPLSGYRNYLGKEMVDISPEPKTVYTINTSRPANADSWVGTTTSYPYTMGKSTVYTKMGLEGPYTYWKDLSWEGQTDYNITFDDVASDLSIGLLMEAPVYYAGETTYTHDSQIYVNNHPALRLKDIAAVYYDEDPTTFLEVREIPNASYGYFTDVDSTGYSPDPTKIANGGYWTSYTRYKYSQLQTMPTGTLELKTEKAEKEGEISKYWISGGQTESHELTFNTDITTFNTDEHEYELDYYASNSSYMLIGENTNSVAWPQVNYFGVFSSTTPGVKVRVDQNNNPHMMDSTLLYWGELTENNSWYHAVANPVSGKTYYVRTTTPGQTGYTYTEYTGELPPPSGTTLYEKTGVIVEPSQGGIFSRQGFQLRWCAPPMLANGDLPLN